MAPGILIDSASSEVPYPTKTTRSDGYGNYKPRDPHDLKLESNFGPMDPEQIGYLQPTFADTPMEVMRERYFRDGYLHVKRCPKR